MSVRSCALLTRVCSSGAFLYLRNIARFKETVAWLAPILNDEKQGSGMSRLALSAVWNRAHVRVTALVAVTAVAAATGVFTGAVPSSVAHASAPAVSPGVPVKGLTDVTPKRVPVPNQAGRAYRATATVWPRAASGSTALAVPPAGRSAGPIDRVGGTPVWVQAVVVGSNAQYQGPSKVTATVLPHAQAVALGISAAVFDVSGSGSGQDSVRVGLDYAAFAQAYGGNYGSRLQLVALPQCALTTPQLAECRTQTPLDSIQDPKTSSVSAVVRLGSSMRTASVARGADAIAASSPSGGAQVIGATDSTGQEGGEGGGYSAAKLSPAGTWAEGGDSGAFTYSYPITLPSASTALAPSLSLSYDSQQLDGQTAVTQTQSSWLGDGWSTPNSFIALSTTPCDDDPEGTASPTSTHDMCYDGKIVQMSLSGTDTPLVFVSSSTANGVTTSTWLAQNDSGDVITHVASSSSVFGAYSLGNDYWTVTGRNGTEYEFGLQHLPGWASGDGATNSVDTMPVYSAHSGDPCYSSSGFTSSVCTMAYEWQLDYTVDTHNSAISYYYDQATNYYGEDAGAKDVSYVSDSYLDHIDYGFQAGGAYGTVPDKVVFTAAPRCVMSTCGALSTSNTDVATQYPDVPVDLMCASGAKCVTYAPSMFSQVRLTAITTEQYSTAISKYDDIDSYDFTQTEPASGDGLSPTLWLASISRNGDDISAGGSSGPSAPLTVSFTGTDLPNRVFTATYPGLYRFRIASVTGEMGAVTTVTYGTPDQCSSSYSSTSTSAVTSANTDSCFPVYWTPVGQSQPTLDWFESYAVTQVLVADPTGKSLQEETDYTYGGGAAWHYDDNEVVQPKYRTYGQFRGYAKVTAYTGQVANNPQTEKTVQYYRGMDGDTSPSGTSSVTLADSQHGTHADTDRLAGQPLESTTYLGVGGPVVSSTITSYWVSAAAATESRPGLPDLTATMTEPAETWTRTALTDGGEQNAWRVTETDDSYDTTTTDAGFGLRQYSYSHTDPVVSAYDSCTTDEYAPANTAKNLVGLTSYTETDRVACTGYTAGAYTSVPAFTALGAPSNVSGAQVSKAVETFYDDTAFKTTFPQAAAPSVGNATMVRQAVSGTPGAFTWQTEKRNTYDAYGRVEDAYDADGNLTTTTYTVNSVGLTTADHVAVPSTTYTNSAGTAVTTTHTSSTELDPTRNLTLTATDQNGVTTIAQYDALGRLTSVWKNSRPTSAPANVTYAYTESNSSISGVVTETLNDEGNFVPMVTIYDSLGRVRQTQTLATTPTGDGRLISDTIYDSRGLVGTKNTDYYDDASEPALTLVSAPSNQVPRQDDYVYDGAGRQVEDVSENDAQIVATTVTVYNGDSSTTVPDIPGAAASGPIKSGAGTVATTVTNPLGQTVQLVEYTANPTLDIPADPSTGVFYLSGGTGTPDTTAYTYDAQGKQVSTTDAHNNRWTQTYDLLGRETSSTSPNAGTTTMTYDENGNLLTSVDAEGNTTAHTYDQLGRKTAEYQWSGNGSPQNYVSASQPGDETDSWVYDNANGVVPSMTDPKGELTTETAYANGYAYDTQQIGFNVFGESTGEVVYIPSGAPGAALGSSFVLQNTYEPVNGTLVKTSYPSGGGLPAETVSYSTTTALDLLSAVGGLNGYAEGAKYTAYGQVEQVTVGAGSNEAYLTDQYDPHTGNLTDQLVTRSTASPTDVDDTSYTYNAAGSTTSETDVRLGSAATSETQCFTYTPQAQLSEAWTATDDCAATPSTNADSSVGDALGAGSKYFESFTYNSAGERGTESALDPSTGAFATTTYGYSSSHTTAPTSTTTTGASGGSTSYGYNSDGEQDSRQTPAGDLTLSWNDTQQMTGVTQTGTGNQVASYVYGPEGALLSQTNGTTTTLYLPEEQISVDSATGAVSGERYYSLPGGLMAVRTGSGTSDYDFELASDQHGTNTLLLDATAQVPTWRQYDPFGNSRGTAAAWVDNRTFLNDVTDQATGLTAVGVRWYDASIGAFVSPDPVLQASDPAQIASYDYAGNNPIGSSDPSGATRIDEGGPGLNGCGDSCGGSNNEGGCWGPGGEWTCGDTLGNTYNDKGSTNTTTTHVDKKGTFVSADQAGIVYIQSTDPEYHALKMKYQQMEEELRRQGVWYDGATGTQLDRQVLATWAQVCENSNLCDGAVSGNNSFARIILAAAAGFNQDSAFNHSLTFQGQILVGYDPNPNGLGQSSQPAIVTALPGHASEIQMALSAAPDQIPGTASEGGQDTQVEDMSDAQDFLNEFATSLDLSTSTIGDPEQGVQSAVPDVPEGYAAVLVNGVPYWYDANGQLTGYGANVMNSLNSVRGGYAEGEVPGSGNDENGD